MLFSPLSVAEVKAFAPDRYAYHFHDCVMLWGSSNRASRLVSAIDTDPSLLPYTVRSAGLSHERDWVTKLLGQTLYAMAHKTASMPVSDPVRRFVKKPNSWLDSEMIVLYIDRMTNTFPTSGRPGRPREFDSDAALDKAIAHFSEYGYHGTSISDLHACLGLTSGSIYKAWGDKRGLFLAALDRYMEVRAEAIRSCLAAENSGRDKVSALLMMYAQLSSGAVGRTGCLVVESAVELSMSDPEIAKRIAAQQKKRETQLRQLLEVGQEDGSVRRELDAAVTARLLLTLQQGMRVLGKTGATAKYMQGLIPEMLRLLD